MLSEYQTAILEEMGITAVVELAEKVDSKASRKVNKNSEHFSDSTSKIQSLRESLSTNISPSNISLSHTPKSSTKIVNREALDTDNVTNTISVIEQRIDNLEHPIIEDIMSAFENASITLPVAAKWVIDKEHLASFTPNVVILPNQPNLLNPSQKRILWNTIVDILKKDD